jgi:hypothetical protein
MKKILLFVIFSSFLFSTEPIEYGWDIPHTPLRVGGYIDALYDKSIEEKFLFEDLSLLLSANQNRFDFLSEIEISHFNLDGKSHGSADIDPNFERLQLMYTIDDTHAIKVGRFNSDVDFWNQAPVNILQETTTVPHITRSLYPKATTGISYIKTFNDEDKFSITFQNNRDIGDEYADWVVADKHISLAYHGVNDEFLWSLASGFYREEKSQHEAYYAGVGVEYEYKEGVFQAELFTQKGEEGLSKPYSAYLESTWNFSKRQNIVMRLEAYDDEELATEEVVSLLGYVYRPFSNLALKGEYVHHSDLPLNRFVASFSVMF